MTGKHPFSGAQRAITLALAAALGGLFGGAQVAVAAEAPILIDLYREFVETPGVGIAFSAPAGQLGATEINFLPAAPWWPLGEAVSFGAQLSTALQVVTGGDYRFTLGSDDASYLFIDGQLAMALPDAHSYYTTQQTLTLTAGTHALTLQFYNSYCCGSQLTLDPGGLAYVSALPEPGRAALWLGAALTGGLAWRRRPATAARG